MPSLPTAKNRYDKKDYKECGHSLAAMVDGMAVLQLDNSFKDQRIMSKEAHLRKAKEEFLSRFSHFKLRYRYDIQNMPHTADINLVTTIIRVLLQRIAKSKGMLIRLAGERYFRKIRRCQKIFRNAMERRRRQIRRFLYWWSQQEEKLRQTAEERSRQRIWLLDNLSHLTPARLAQRKKILKKRLEEETNFDIPLHCKIHVLSQSRRDAFVRFAKEWSSWRESLSNLNREYSAAKAREAFIQKELQSASGFVAHSLRNQLTDVQSIMNTCMTRVLVMKPEPQWAFDSCDLNFIVLLTHARELKLLEEAKNEPVASVTPFVRENPPIQPGIDREMRIAQRRVAKGRGNGNPYRRIGQPRDARVSRGDAEDDEEEPMSEPAPPKIEIDFACDSAPTPNGESPILSKQLEQLLDSSSESTTDSDVASDSSIPKVAESRRQSVAAPILQSVSISDVEAVEEECSQPIQIIPVRRIRSVRRKDSVPMVITASGLRRMKCCFRNSGVAATEMERRELGFMKKEGWLEQLIEGKTVPQSSFEKVKRRPPSPSPREFRASPLAAAPPIAEASPQSALLNAASLTGSLTGGLTSSAASASAVLSCVGSTAKSGGGKARVRRGAGLALCAVGTALETAAPKRELPSPTIRLARRAQSALGIM